MIVSIGSVIVGNAPATGPRSTPSASAPNGASPVAAAHPASGGGAVAHGSGTFFSVNNTFAPPNPSGAPCTSYYYNFNSSVENFTEYENECLSGPQDPSSVSYGGQTIGVAYSSLTNDTPTVTCPGAYNLTDSGVYFQNSTNAGANWGTAVALGNATCSYLQSFDPSAAYSHGKTYLTFVEDNATSPALPPYYNLSGDALGFTVSSNKGGNWTTVRSLTAAGIGNLTDPQIGAFGKTVYIVYVNAANWTNLTLPSASYSTVPWYPTSINLIYSTNGGTSWNGPYPLPGQNASTGYSADSPSLAINSKGELAVSYATNRSCIKVNGFCYDYGDSIVVATSTTNGSTWNSPVTVAPVAGEYGCQFDNPLNYLLGCLPGPEQGPHSAIAFDPGNPDQVYVLYTGSYYTWSTVGVNESGPGITTDIGYGQALFAAASSNTGSSWTLSTVVETTSTDGYSYDAITNPSIAVSSTGEVDIAFTWLNDTMCNGCNDAFFEYTSYWSGSSSDQGLTWTLYPALLTTVYEFYMEENWYGLTSATTETSVGPVSIYSEGLGFQNTYSYYDNLTAVPPIYIDWFNYSYSTELLAVFPATATPFAVNFTEVGVPAGLNCRSSSRGTPSRPTTRRSR
jgi:hypothetical protein